MLSMKQQIVALRSHTAAAVTVAPPVQDAQFTRQLRWQLIRAESLFRMSEPVTVFRKRSSSALSVRRLPSIIRLSSPSA